VNHYEVLGLPPDAPAEAVKARYRELAKATHPDAGGGGGVEAFLAVRRAYDVLSQEMLRAEHDQQLGGWPDARYAGRDGGFRRS
jgi:curved DNA-binding protein CbpA